MIRRACVLLLVLAACRPVADPLEPCAGELRSLAAEAAAYRERLRRDLAAHDDLGPGDYQRLLRAAFGDALRALDLEHEARSAAALAGLGRRGVLLDDVARARLLTAGLPASLHDLLHAAVADLEPAAQRR